MCSFKTLLAICVLVAPPAAAQGTLPLLKDFAACAGRYSATMERQWLHSIPGSEESAKRRAAFSDLVDAVMPVAKAEGFVPREALTWRIEAKFAHARLLEVADFGTIEAHRAPARAKAEAYLSECDQMLLAG